MDHKLFNSYAVIGSLVYLTILWATYVEAAPSPQVANKEPEVTIVSQHAEANPDGYSYGYEASNGIKVEEEGVLKDVPNEKESGLEPAIVVPKGSYSYTSDGKTYNVEYTADEFGFRPKGDHIHPEILKALEALSNQPKTTR